MPGATIGGRRHTFSGLREVMAKATPLKSGDVLAGLAAANDEERAAARYVLADTPLTAFLTEPLVPYEDDEVTRLILDSHDAAAFRPVSGLSVGQLRELLLSDQAGPDFLRTLSPGLTPEMAAAVSKIMRNQDLILVSSKISNTASFRSTVGLPGRLCARLQPNHPADDPRGVLASVVDGLVLGSGDACIGINPATDNLSTVRLLLDCLDEVRSRYAIPTQTCVLTHITNTLRAMEAGAPVDLVFQSVGGTQGVNESFGVNLALLKEGRQAALSLKRWDKGGNVMYFETGQGSALSAGSNHGVDQQTLEARAYGVCRAFDPLLVNTVVVFIGPEYLYDGRQIIRAGLEDLFCGKLLGLPMGVDVCYTNHAEADQDDMDVLLTLLGAAGCAYIMGVPGADDLMLGYQSTSFHDALYVRRLLNLRPAPEFEAWLVSMGLFDQALRPVDFTGRDLPLELPS